MLGTRHRTKLARDIVTDLITMVAELRAEDRYDPTAPELTAYLQDRHARDLVNAAAGAERLQRQMGPMPLLRPQIVADVVDVLRAELRRRSGERAAAS